jgi:BirA family biotin operon repressor/biotin-[acetyl-CoA-carboxylase] ligase
MDRTTLAGLLDGLPVPHIRYFESIGSTNDEALAWAADGADDGCLVVADLQTQGRGRLGRHWVTQSGAALAFSLILHPRQEELPHLGFFSPLGAMAISQALEENLGLDPQIKWPNDVLLGRRKAAGILVEAAWVGDSLQGMVIGIGLNVSRAAVPPAEALRFPATSVEESAGRPVDRLELLRAILSALFAWRPRLASQAFRQGWEQRLAFREEWVQVEEGGTESAASGQVVGIDAQGGLLLRDAAGAVRSIAVGDVHLRPKQ